MYVANVAKVSHPAIRNSCPVDPCEVYVTSIVRKVRVQFSPSNLTERYVLSVDDIYVKIDLQYIYQYIGLLDDILFDIEQVLIGVA